MKVKMARDFREHQATLPAALVHGWEEEIRQWDALTDKKGKGSPYREPVYSMYPFYTVLCRSDADFVARSTVVEDGESRAQR